MRWQLGADVDAFQAAAGPWLRRDPAANTVMLAAVAEYRAGHRWSADAPLFGWCGPDIRAAMCRFPPYEFALSDMTVDDATELADALASYPVPAVRGPVRAVDAFTARRVERAGAADVGLVARWLDRFAAEAGSVTVDRTAWVSTAVRRGSIRLWHDHDEPVAVACRHATVDAVSRVGPVYTPPEQRGRGYGSAVTAAVTADALAAGAVQTVLFADLANPTANGIYASLGYRPVHEIRTVHFRVPG